MGASKKLAVGARYQDSEDSMAPPVAPGKWALKGTILADLARSGIPQPWLKKEITQSEWVTYLSTIEEDNTVGTNLKLRF
ncbi:hypothetical protein HanPI659440_Chr05g0197631 [Helianthus annuus]|nr:hypothetical protein HanPI659440_Chr05g0197631 [Helianthus annuus]